MTIDIALLVLTALLGGIGLARGLVKQIWGLGLLVALLAFRPWTMPPADGLLELVIAGDLPGASALRAMVGFVAMYVPLMVIGWFVERRIVRKTPGLNEIDRFGGLALGLAKGVVLSVFLLWAVETVIYKSHTIADEPPESLTESTALRILGGTNPWKVRALSDLLTSLEAAPAGSENPAVAKPRVRTARARSLEEQGHLGGLLEQAGSSEEPWPRWSDTLGDAPLRTALGDPTVARDLLARDPT